MKSWELRTPYFLVRSTAALEPEVEEAWSQRMLLIPGVRKDFRGAWVVPADAAQAAEAARGNIPVQVTWGLQPAPVPTWAEVERFLMSSGEIRPEFLGDWPKPYQKDAICWAWNRTSAHFWHGTGCLAANAEIKWNRAGITRTTTIADLVRRERGDTTRGRKRDPTVRTRVQANVDGCLRLVDLEAVHVSGEKEVFEVKAGGYSLTATKDHKFETPDGFKPLSALTEGDLVLVRGSRVSPKDRRKLQYRQRKVEACPIESIEPRGVMPTFDLSMAAPHSYIASGFSVHNSGKTFSGLVAALSRPGPIIVITKAAVRRQYAREFQRFTGLSVYVMLPAGMMTPRVAVEGVTWWPFYKAKAATGMTLKEVRAAWKQLKATKGIDSLETLPQYLARMKEKGQRPIVVAAWETMRERREELEAVKPTTVVFDEMHTGRNHKRWEIAALRELPEDPAERHARLLEETREARGKGGFIKDTPDGRKMFLPYESVAASAAQLSRVAKRAIGTTATPVANRLSDLWGQLDTIEPNAHGSADSWHRRYCDKKPGTYGGFDIKGESNRGELDARLKHIAHVVPKSVAAKYMPKVQRISLYLGGEDLTRPSAGFAKELRDAHKRGPTAVLEVKLAMAASMKRPAILAIVEEHLRDGLKVAVLTARRRACEEFAHEARKLVKDKPSTGIWSAHGEQSTDIRQGIVDEFMAHPGPCLFVGTGDAFGTGVNLDDADTVFFELLPYTPEKILQWEGRFQRNSTVKSVRMYYPIAEGTVDEHVASTLLDKLPTAQSLSQDTSIQQTRDALAGVDASETEEQFASRVLAMLDED